MHTPISMDLIYAAGGGLVAHTMGPAAGVRSFQQAWEAAILNIPLTCTATHPEVAAAALHQFKQ